MSSQLGLGARNTPESAVVEAVRFDPVRAAKLIQAFAEHWPEGASKSRLLEFARAQAISSDRLERLLAAFVDCGLMKADSTGVSLTVNTANADRYAAVLRGVTYEQYCHRDANAVDVTLSPPAHPSRLMQILPKQDFSWARLYDTKDNLYELASSAQTRFAILSPFLDGDGIDWILQLFQASLPRRIERTLVTRGRDASEVKALSEYRHEFSAMGATVLGYSIMHDPGMRNPMLETFHAKILLADSDRAYIGSANMNRASRDISMECGVVISGPCVLPVVSLVRAIISIATPIQFPPAG